MDIKNVDNLWAEVKSNLEQIISPIHFKTYIPGTYIKKINEEDLLIEITSPSEFQRNFIEERMYGHIKESITNLIGPKYRLMFSVTQKEVKQMAMDDVGPLFEQKVAIETNISQVKKDAGLNPQYTFERFVVGNSNRLAYAVATGIAENPGKIYNPFFVYSGVGLGKTHLVQAIGHKIIEKHPNYKVLYKTGEQFLNEVVDALRKSKTPGDPKRNALKKNYRNVDVLIIDDIHSIAGKEATQEEFFHTFNALYMSQKQIILTSDRPPKEIRTLEERLSSRFSSGMIADIQKPDTETKIAILRERNEELRLNIRDDVLAYIAEAVESNIRELEGKLLQTATKAMSQGIDLNESFAKQIIGDINKNKQKLITPDSIIQEVCDYYAVSIKDLKGQRRMKPIVMPRQICMYLFRDVLKMSLVSIGELLGRKDHTTVIHALQKIEELLKDKTNAKVHNDVSFLKEKILG
ncbi:MAG: chromosomal replication initiator protein DnaA [Niabella sp.]|nr:MAG: chromosomal replication initiator protein DnaA [Niabella sp.]